MSADSDWSVDDDPDSTAEGMQRPDLSGIPEEAPVEDATWDPDADPDGHVIGIDTQAYELPEIVPATEPAPAETTAPQPVARVVPVSTARTTTPAPVTIQPPINWPDHAATVAAPPSQLRAPGRRPRVRRVTRVVRHVDPWSVFKIGLIFSLVTYVVALTSGVLLWRVADATGTIDNVERWFTQFGWETFEFHGGEIFHNAWIVGLFGVVAMTGGLVLLATLFNLVSDIVGGIRVTVLEEEVVERTISSARRFPGRRPSPATTNGTVSDPSWSVDDIAVDTRSPATQETPPANWSVDD